MGNNIDEDAINEGSHASNVDITVIINCAIIAALILISITGNLIVLAAIKRTSSLRSPSIIFICSLAVSDLVVGFIVQPLFIARELTNSDLVKSLLETTAYAACGFSLFIMTAISMDRYVALHYHMRYPSIVTSTRATYLIATVFLVNFLAAIIYFWNRTIYLFIMATGICICLLTSVAFYVKIYQIVRRHQTQIHTFQVALQRTQATTYTTMTQLKRSVINTFVFFIVIVVCYFPKLVSLAIYNLSFKNWTISWKFANTAIFMNSSINPLLYCWRLRDLRRAVIKTARQLFCRKSE